MEEIKGQLTLKGVIIGCVGCVVITLSSAYVALKMGALPWPIVFAALVSLFMLRLFGSRSLNEANVTHTIMSSGAMVAGGLAFTIPGIWILRGESVSYMEMFVVALAGVIFGVVCSVALRRYFVEEAKLEFPIGEAAAQTLIASDTGGKTAATLFSAVGISGLWTVLRDALGVLPTFFCSTAAIPGVTFAIYNSPMMLAVGALLGLVPALFWFAGALFGNFGIVAGAGTLGLWSIETGQGIASSLGMGIMMGCGVAVVVKHVIPWVSVLKDKLSAQKASESEELSAENTQAQKPAYSKRLIALAVFALALAALLICFFLQLGPLPTCIIVLLVWVTSAMAAQCVGQTGIDPMEIFGLLVLIVVAALSDLPQVQLFFVAGIVAVTCGLAGDVMNDFRAGYVLGTSPKAQWIGQSIGGVVGAVVAAAALFIMVEAYGCEAFGVNGSFVATQASVVATMIGGVPSPVSFAIGFVAGLALYFTGAPIMVFGLGVYLPFYLSFTAFLGAMLKFLYDVIVKRRNADLKQAEQNAQLVTAGLIGGESIVGVIIALVTLVCGFGV